jgi:ABC-type transport system involved in cytochrome c biogenesis permease component
MKQSPLCFALALALSFGAAALALAGARAAATQGSRRTLAKMSLLSILAMPRKYPSATLARSASQRRGTSTSSANAMPTYHS